MTTKQVFAFVWLIGPGAALSAVASTITVTTYSDTVANDGKCSLREAITAANNNIASGAAAGECVAGTTALDTIVYSVVEFCPIAGCATSLLTPLPDITSAMTIVGPASSLLALQPGGGAKIRIFNVSTGNPTIPTSISGFTIRNGDILDVDGGGGVRNAAPVLNLTDCVFRNNKVTGTSNSRQGGGLLNAGGTVNVSNCTFTQNAATRGGGIYNNGTLIAAGSTFTANVAGTSNTNGQGGGIAEGSSATTTVTDCMFSDNFAGERGGAILTDGTTFTLTGSTLTANKAGGAGGAISSFAPCNIANSTIAGNMAGQIAGGGFNGSGGAIENTSGTMNVTNTTISGNMADNTGGGILNHATLNVTNSTIAGNSNTGGGATEGGGIHSLPTGGMFPTFPVTKIKSSIVALNSSTTSPDVAGNVTSNGFNLIGKSDGSTGFTATTDRTGTIAAPLDPKLDPNGLQSNGGMTTTIALLLGSPAIDKGTSAGLTGDLTTDQRGSGFPRIFDDSVVANAAGGDGTDIGAFESQTAQPTKLANISTRLRVETGDNVLIGGFIITGAAPKKVIVRAIGPSLPVPGKLENPTLELHGPGGLITSNDNWREAPNREEIIDRQLPPSDDLESAILATLPANSTGYTAIVRGSSGGTGVGLVEIFDVDQTVESKLANISSRGLVQTGDNVMIGGFIAVGTATQRVVVRVVGPSLPVPGALADPTLELYNRDGMVIASNDNWRSDQEADIIATGLMPTNNMESAIVTTLPPAAHTAIVRGKNQTTGVALVEVFAID